MIYAFLSCKTHRAIHYSAHMCVYMCEWTNTRAIWMREWQREREHLKMTYVKIIVVYLCCARVSTITNWIILVSSRQSFKRMPLIIISGLPASGKTHRANELKAFFIGKGKNVHVVSENVAIPKAGYRKNEYYDDSKKEKIVRSDLKSEALRSLNRDDVIILDAGNYIKGNSP